MTTETHVRLLDARDIEYHAFEHQHFLRQGCVRLDHRRQLWSAGQKVPSASGHLRPQTLVLDHSGTANRQTPRNNNCMSTIASLDVSLLFRQRFDKTEACLPSAVRPTDTLTRCRPLAIFERDPHKLLSPAPVVSISSCRRRCCPLIVMDVHVVHPGSNSMISSAQMFDVHVIYATVTSVDRAWCVSKSRKKHIAPRRRRGNPNHPNVRSSHVLSVSFQHVHNPQDISHRK